MVYIPEGYSCTLYSAFFVIYLRTIYFGCCVPRPGATCTFAVTGLSSEIFLLYLPTKNNTWKMTL
jgi:hypothetical protein